MGTLIAFRYPTNLLARLADHTYVACGTLGKAWSCWGGSTGGSELNRAAASTERADRIAGPDERAGIRCYLINGVCHQAANRILLPAGITVLGARGYSVSEALFGTYGRPNGILGFCRAPFLRHAGVTGDLPECRQGPLIGLPRPAVSEATDPARQAFLAKVLAMYEAADTGGQAFADADEVLRFQLELFAAFVDHKLGGDRLDRKEAATAEQRDDLMQLRKETEIRRFTLESDFGEHGDAVKFANDYNKLTIEFQGSVEGVLRRPQYNALFDLEPGDHVILADPEIAEHAYEPRPRPGPRGP